MASTASSTMARLYQQLSFDICKTQEDDRSKRLRNQSQTSSDLFCGYIDYDYVYIDYGYYISINN
ncbi:hypothetical protein U9M48_035148 [Paspalum notatum var. saurae]|uniref:Uncharacterized protein n=1 Tax=Paspalum notatum var. saurae TaxID=547442 RepID=A0AAQ3UC05_PASNO